MTAPDSLRLRGLRVRRTPGIDDPFTLSGFCESVNLVFGPNASGKSSTARAIEALLWPTIEGTQRLEASADYTLNGSQFVVKLDDGCLEVQRDGLDAKPPALPAPEFRHRYRLSLHELLLATESAAEFAAEIARQSAGGYDFGAAVQALGYQSKPSTARHAQALDEARSRLRALQQRQLALHEEARKLAELEADATAAGAARAHEQVLGRAVEHAERAGILDTARSWVAEFPAVLERLRGDEAARLEELKERLASAEEEESAEAQRAADALEAAAMALPLGAIAHERIHELQKCAGQLEEIDRDVSEVERRVAEARAQVTVARQALGDALTDAQLEAIDATSFGDLSAFAREAEQLHGKVAAAEAEIRVSSDATATRPTVSAETANAGVRLLAQWLEGAGPPPAAGRAPHGLLAILLLSSLSAIGWLALAIVWHPVAWVALIATILVAAIAFKGRTTGRDTRQVRQADFAALGLETPKQWAIEHVVELLDRLQRVGAEARLAEQRAQWVAAARGRREALVEDEARLDTRRVELEGRLGVAPDGDALRLAWLGEQITRWRNALAALRGTEAALTTAQAQRQGAFDAIAQEAAALGVAAPASIPAALALPASLADRQRDFDAATDRAAEARRREADAVADRRRIEANIEEIFNSCECSGGDFATVGRLCDSHAAYTEACEKFRVATHGCTAARAALESNPLFDASLITQGVGELKASREQAATLAADFERLVKESTALRTRVDEAKKQHDVEAALAEVAEAEIATRECCRRDLRAMIGDALLKHVQRATRDQDRPAVFHRARDLFATITCGRYCLEFDDNDAGSATFRAMDTITKHGHALSELSSATRVQLLLAVRVAFVESQENGVKLPLFLDETLGTSDDYRAAAIIDAVAGLAQSGRQVFYFTAQRDEAAKWTSALRARGVELQTFDLAALRGLPDDSSSAIPVATLSPESVAAVPVSEGHSHESYGQALSVPAIRPGIGTAAGAHLWYLVKELGALQRLLGFGVSTWGELENLVEHGGVKNLAEYPQAYARARAIARAIDTMHDQARTGRGLLVDRAVLRASDAISDKKLDEVAAAAAQCDGNGRRLLEALERREVAGLQAKKVAALRDYLEREGFLDARPTRSPSEIRAAMLGAVTDDIQADTLQSDDIDRLVKSIDQRATPTPVSGVEATLPSSGDGALRSHSNALPS